MRAGPARGEESADPVGLYRRKALLQSSKLMDRWTIGNSEDLYAVQNWGKGYFGVNELGNVTVCPDKNPAHAIDLKVLVDEIRQRGIHPPLLLRFTDILKHRLGDIYGSFSKAISECGYQGTYRCVYPIKVNQQRHIVEEIHDFGKEYGFGLEAGSKPELLAVLALVDDQNTPIICNGFKDAAYIEAVVLARKIGKLIIPVIEKFSELELLVEHAAKHDVRPLVGVRVKLASRGSGRWESSGGQGSKFGLTIGEVIRALDYLHARGMAEQLQLLHFHIGSQITNIRNIKDAINEAARVYVELVKNGAGLRYLDVGGGLGIDYDGSQTNFGSSVNYTLNEYAADIVFGIQSVCDQAKVAHPTIISESGRAVAAHHSVLVFNVLGVSEVADSALPPRSEIDPSVQPVKNLYDTLGELTAKNVLEMYHDAIKYRDDAFNLFNLGYVTIQQRNLAEQVFWAICRSVHKIAQQMDYIPEDLQGLESMLSDTYFCNFSLFQSMPDSWAVHQLFPVMPIHRLNERPDRRATLADITCDSDGKIDRFIDLRDVKKVLELHSPNGSEYYLAAFLTGAYQEILGDLHNLFGDTHAVHVRLDDQNKPAIDIVVKGDTVREVLQYVQFSAEELFTRLRRDVETALRRDRITVEEAGRLLQFYESGLDSYTYLS
ncbi:MAG: biosynthetic arginine decarboxylase [Planctomycetota bacterium]